MRSAGEAYHGQVTSGGEPSLYAKEGGRVRGMMNGRRIQNGTRSGPRNTRRGVPHLPHAPLEIFTWLCTAQQDGGICTQKNHKACFCYRKTLTTACHVHDRRF